MRVVGNDIIGEQMKIAINTDWGGFGLSKQAFERLFERKNIQYEVEYCSSSGTPIIPTYYVSGLPHTEENVINEYSLYRERSDRDLVAVIEELGETANGFSANISIIEIPDGVEWEVVDYDGIEHVAEKHRKWHGN